MESQGFNPAPADGGDDAPEHPEQDEDDAAERAAQSEDPTSPERGFDSIEELEREQDDD